MADTRAATGLTVQQWDDKFFDEYIDEVDFADIMGETPNAIIQIQRDLSKKKGDSVTFAFLNRLTQQATTGSNVLEGMEEDMTSRSHRIYVDQRRHAVRISVTEEQKSAIGLREAMKPMLKTWAMEHTRDTIINALGSINGVLYASASEVQKDAWLVDNADRVLFGAAKANNSANDHSAALAQIDSTNDTLTRSAVSLMKRIAITADPKIRPVRDPGNGKRYFVMYAHPFAFRDLRTNLESTLDDTTAGGEAMKLFQGGDLLWDGVVIKELLDMPVYTGVGGGSIDVAPAYLVGAQAIGYAQVSDWKTKTKLFDYDDKAGTAIAAIDGFAKLIFGSGTADTDDLKDHGLVTGYFANVAD